MFKVILLKDYIGIVKELNKYLMAFIFIIFLFFSNTKLFAGDMFKGQYFNSNSNLDLNSNGSIKSLKNFDFTLYDSLVNKELSIVIAIYSMIEDNTDIPKTVDELIKKGYLPNSFNDNNLINSNKITFKIDRDNNIVIINTNIQDSEIPVYFKEYYLNNTYTESSSFNNINFFRTQFIENNSLKTKYYLTRKAINILETKDTLTNNLFGIGGSGAIKTYIGNKEPSSYDNSIPNNSIWYDSNIKEFEFKKRIDNQWSDIYSSNKNIDENGNFLNSNSLSIVAIIKNFENVTVTEETKNIVCRTSGATYNQQTNRCEAFTSDACDGNSYDIRSDKCYITADSYCSNNGYSGYDSSVGKCYKYSYANKECPSWSYEENNSCYEVINPLKISCHDSWVEFAKGGFYNEGLTGIPKGEIKEHKVLDKTYTFLTSISYKCSSMSKVYFKQRHRTSLNGEVIHDSHSNLFTLDLTGFNESKTFDTGRRPSVEGGLESAVYYTPTSTGIVLVYMDGLFFRVAKEGGQLIVKVENTYDKMGWYPRDIVGFQSPLERAVAKRCPPTHPSDAGNGLCRKEVYANIPTNYRGYNLSSFTINGSKAYIKTPNCNGKRMTVSPYSPTSYYGNNGICYSDIGLYCKTYASSVNVIQMPNGKQVTCWDRTQNCGDNRFNLVYDYSGIQDKCNKYNYSCNNKSLYGLAEHPTFNNARDLFNRISDKYDKVIPYTDKIVRKENIILNDNNGAMCVENIESIYNSIPKDYNIDNKVKTGF